MKCFSYSQALSQFFLNTKGFYTGSVRQINSAGVYDRVIQVCSSLISTTKLEPEIYNLGE